MTELAGGITRTAENFSPRHDRGADTIRNRDVDKILRSPLIRSTQPHSRKCTGNRSIFYLNVQRCYFRQ